MRAAWGLAGVLGLLAGPAAAEAGDAVAGAAVARAWCSGCHVIDRRGGGTASDAVPSFPAIARRPSTTAMSLRVFLQTPHANMPNYQLSETELDDVVAHLLSLRGGR